MLKELNEKIGYCLEFKSKHKLYSTVEKRYNAGECDAYTDCKDMLESVIEKIENQIIELEDMGWYEADDKEQAIESMYKVLAILKGESE